MSPSFFLICFLNIPQQKVGIKTQGLAAYEHPFKMRSLFVLLALATVAYSQFNQNLPCGFCELKLTKQTGEYLFKRAPVVLLSTQSSTDLQELPHAPRTPAQPDAVGVVRPELSRRDLTTWLAYFWEPTRVLFDFRATLPVSSRTTRELVFAASETPTETVEETTTRSSQEENNCYGRFNEWWT